MPLAPLALSYLSRTVTGVEIHPGAQIGSDFFIDHGSGVVIGETSEIGDCVTLYQGVTLGGTGFQRGKRHPTVGDNVTIGSGAKLLGPVEVGHGAKIGANTVVVEDVPAQATVVGNPGHTVKVEGQRVEGPDADWIHLPDPIADAIRDLSGSHRGARAQARRPGVRGGRGDGCGPRAAARARAARRPGAERAESSTADPVLPRCADRGARARCLWRRTRRVAARAATRTRSRRSSRSRWAATTPTACTEAATLAFLEQTELAKGDRPPSTPAWRAPRTPPTTPNRSRSRPSRSRADDGHGERRLRGRLVRRPVALGLTGRRGRLEARSDGGPDRLRPGGLR